MTYNAGMREPDFLVFSAETEKAVAYEPFPEPGAPVHISHPAFTYDEGLRCALAGYRLALAIALKWNDISELYVLTGFLRDGGAIPEHHLALMLSQRDEWLAEEGLPADLPIGYQFVAGYEDIVQAQAANTPAKAMADVR